MSIPPTPINEVPSPLLTADIKTTPVPINGNPAKNKPYS